MKKNILYAIFLLPFILLLMPGNLKAQCGDELLDICHSKLGNARFIRSFPVQHSEQESGASPRVARYDVILNSGTTYKIFACNDETKPGEVVVSLYRGDQLIATTYNVNTQRHFPAIEYPCNASGKYSLTFMFVDGKEGCAVGVLSTVN